MWGKDKSGVHGQQEVGGVDAGKDSAKSKKEQLSAAFAETIRIPHGKWRHPAKSAGDSQRVEGVWGGSQSASKTLFGAKPATVAAKKERKSTLIVLSKKGTGPG